MVKNELREPSIDFGFGRVIYKEQKDLSKYRVLNLENESLSLIVNNKGKLTSFLQGAKFNKSLFSKEYKDVDLYWVCPENGISYYDSKKFELKLKYVDKKDNSSKLLSFNYFFKYKFTSPIQFISKIIVKINSTRETYTSDLIINLLRNKVSFDELIQDNVQQIINNCTTLDEVDDKLKKFNLNELNDKVSEYGVEIINIKFNELALDDLITKEEALKAKEDCINEVAENMKSTFEKEITDLKSDMTVGFSVIKNDVDSIKSNQDSMIANQEDIKSQGEAVLNNQPKNDLEDSQVIKEIINQQKELSDKLGAILSNQEDIKSQGEAVLNNQPKNDLEDSQVIKDIINQQKELSDKLGVILSNQEDIKSQGEAVLNNQPKNDLEDSQVIKEIINQQKELSDKLGAILSNQEDIKSQGEAVLNNQPKNDLEDSQVIKDIINQQKELSDKLGVILSNQEDIKSQGEAVLNNQPKNDLEDSQVIKEIINQQKELSDKLGAILSNQEDIKSQGEAALNNQPKNDLEDSQVIKEIITQQKELSDKLGAILSNQEDIKSQSEAANSKLDQSLDNDHVIITNQEKQNSKLDRIESKISSLHDYFKDRKEEQKEFKNQLTQLLQNSENIKELFEKQNLPAIPTEIIDKPLNIKKFIDEHYDEIVDSITLTPEFLIDAAKTLDDFCVYASLIYHSLENSLLNKYHLRADKTDYYYLEDEIKEIYSKLGSNYQIGGYDNSGNLKSVNNQNNEFKFKYLIPNNPNAIQFYNRHNLDFNESKLYKNNDSSFKFAYAYEDSNHPENKRYSVKQAKFIGHLMSDYNSFRHQSEDCKTKRNMMLNNYKNQNSAKVSGYDDVEVMKLMCMDHLAKLHEYKAI